MKTLAFLFFALVFSFQVSAQAMFKPGYVVNNSGEKITGEIDLQDWGQNPTSIKFRNASGNIETLTIKDLQAFEITGETRYERAIVSINNRPVNVMKGDYIPEEKNIIDTVLLRVILMGNPLSIYEYVDFKLHLYYKNAAGAIEELYFGDNDVSYRQQLKDVIPGITEAQEKKLNILPYKTTKLHKFATEVNTATTYGAYEPAAKRKSVAFFAGGGASYQTMYFKSQHRYLNQLHFKSISPMVNAGMDILLGKNRQVGSARIAISYYKMASTGTTVFPAAPNQNHEKLEYQVEQQTFSGSLGFTFNIIDQEFFKIYAGGLISAHISQYPVNNFKREMIDFGYTVNDGAVLDFKKNWSSINFQSGAIVNNRFDINLSSMLVGKFFETALASQKGTRFQLNVMYRMYR